MLSLIFTNLFFISTSLWAQSTPPASSDAPTVSHIKISSGKPSSINKNLTVEEIKDKPVVVKNNWDFLYPEDDLDYGYATFMGLDVSASMDFAFDINILNNLLYKADGTRRAITFPAVIASSIVEQSYLVVDPMRAEENLKSIVNIFRNRRYTGGESSVTQQITNLERTPIDMFKALEKNKYTYQLVLYSDWALYEAPSEIFNSLNQFFNNSKEGKLRKKLLKRIVLIHTREHDIFTFAQVNEFAQKLCLEIGRERTDGSYPTVLEVTR